VKKASEAYFYRRKKLKARKKSVNLHRFMHVRHLPDMSARQMTRHGDIRLCATSIIMDAILTIDRGNSRTKLALWALSSRSPLRVMTLKGVSHSDLSAVIGSHRLIGAAYCTVCGEETTFTNRLHAFTDKVLCVTAHTATPLAMGYTGVNTLGADRLAAAVGAYALSSNADDDILVVDLGTAITYDLVSRRTYCGGNIAAGLSMRLKALNAFTARLPLVDACGTVETWGTDTVSALRSGAIRGVVGELSHYRHLLGPDAKVTVTGGSADFIVPHLDFDVTLEPHLVSYGLREIYIYNNPELRSRLS